MPKLTVISKKLQKCTYFLYSQEIQYILRPVVHFLLDKIICEHLHYEIVITTAYNRMYF